MQSLWMLVASFVFAAMGVCVKLAADYFSTSEIVMTRGIIGMLFIYSLIRLRGGTLKTALAWHHLWRGVVGVTALWLWFYSIALLPLATAVTLNYMSPIWIAAILFAARLVAPQESRRLAAGAGDRPELRRRHAAAAAGDRRPINGSAACWRWPPACWRRWPTWRCGAWARWASRNTAWCFTFP